MKLEPNLEDWTLAELVDYLYRNPNDNHAGRVTYLINNYQFIQANKMIDKNIDFIKTQHKILLAKTFNNDKSIINLENTRIQCADCVTILNNFSPDYDFIENRKVEFETLKDDYLLKFKQMLQSINEKIAHRAKKDKQLASIPVKLEEIIVKLQPAFNDKIWLCKNLETALRVFNVDNETKEKFTILPGQKKNLFYILHKLYDNLKPKNTSKEKYYYRFFANYNGGSMGIFKRCSKITSEYKTQIDKIFKE
jgi:hypothetical protein